MKESIELTFKNYDQRERVIINPVITPPSADPQTTHGQ